MAAASTGTTQPAPNRELKMVVKALSELQKGQARLQADMEKRAAEDRVRRLQEETLAYSERMKEMSGMAAAGSTQPLPSVQEVSGTGLPGTAEMRRQFEQFAAKVAEDSGAAKARGRAPEEQPAQRRENSISSDQKISELLARCEHASQNPAQVWAKVLKEFKDVPGKDWHMPTGFQERLAPEVLSRVYIGVTTCVAFINKLLEEKQLMDCLFVQSTKDAAEALDRAILHDKIPGFVNTTVCELWARQLYSTEVGFAKVKRQADWLKPRADKGGWKSKVDFDMIARLNPMTASSKVEPIKAAETEVKMEMTRDALFSRARNEGSSAVGDLINQY